MRCLNMRSAIWQIKRYLRSNALHWKKNISCLKKEKRLQDADDSEIQIYNLSGKKIHVYNSYYLNEVYERSDVDFDGVFLKDEKEKLPLLSLPTREHGHPDFHPCSGAASMVKYTHMRQHRSTIARFLSYIGT